MLRLLLLANVGLLAAACSGSPQIAAPTPKPTPTSTAPAPPVTSTSGSWIITLTTLSDTGPTFCIHQPSVGSTFSTDYQLVFGGDTVEFVPPDPIDWDSFTAKVDGLNFSGANPPVGSGYWHVRALPTSIHHRRNLLTRSFFVHCKGDVVVHARFGRSRDDRLFMDRNASGVTQHLATG